MRHPCHVRAAAVGIPGVIVPYLWDGIRIAARQHLALQCLQRKELGDVVAKLPDRVVKLDLHKVV